MESDAYEPTLQYAQVGSKMAGNPKKAKTPILLTTPIAAVGPIKGFFRTPDIGLFF